MTNVLVVAASQLSDPVPFIIQMVSGDRLKIPLIVCIHRDAPSRSKDGDHDRKGRLTADTGSDIPLIEYGKIANAPLAHSTDSHLKPHLAWGPVALASSILDEVNWSGITRSPNWSRKKSDVTF